MFFNIRKLGAGQFSHCVSFQFLFPDVFEIGWQHICPLYPSIAKVIFLCPCSGE